jgi:hypothetical protein
MPKGLLIIILCAFSTGLKGQLQADRLSFDFGNIEYFNNDTAYFTFTNTGSKTIYLLQTQPKDDYAILCDTKTILPGEQIHIGIVYYTGEKGRFNLNIPLHFSHLSSPMQISIKGNIKSIVQTAYATCPSIENTSPLKAGQVPLSIIVKDAETSERIDEARVQISKKNAIYNCVPGFASMAYQCKCDYGRIQVKAEKQGYEPADMWFDYDAKNNTCIIFLDRKKAETRHDSIPEYVEKKETITEKEEVPVYVPVAYADSGFNSYKYKPNHLIFIIDVSKSMKDSIKLNYLKQVMKELVNGIRLQDRVTLITYAGRVKVVFENVGGAQKQQLLYAIDTLTANGGSNGAKSLEIAYEIANRHFIEGGNNQVFLATDGLFNSSSITDEDLYKIARREYNRNKIILSTIGFGRDQKALDFLDKLSRSGRGSFLSISSLPGDLSILLDEVKKQSALH